MNTLTRCRALLSSSAPLLETPGVTLIPYTHKGTPCLAIVCRDVRAFVRFCLDLCNHIDYEREDDRFTQVLISNEITQVEERTLNTADTLYFWKHLPPMGTS